MASPNIPEIVFFDLETTVPNKIGQRFWVLEFGAIIVCPRKLVELESYCTLIRPGDLSAVAAKSGRPHGITRQAVAAAPSFEEVADEIFKILDGRIWAGHNIQRFDCVRIREMFADINRPAPNPAPAGIIDSLGVLREKFGTRAGNMKMATLATYFGLGQQKHRSLDDVRMNLEVMKHCATVLFLESSLPPSALNWQWQSSPNVTTRSRSLLQSSSGAPTTLNVKPLENRGKSICRDETSRKSPPSTSAGHKRALPYARESLGKMTARVKNVICNARSRPLNNLLKHSQSLIR
ncbi:Polynucleotidyl transferase [Perilla frutescens var. hirtella]|nr:Polynucleotidyl transferase [Perilla frutescens var. frutescens]KAH6784414.1 Polynucleotidyl transferase [Perilla frutescens var. hirtella]